MTRDVDSPAQAGGIARMHHDDGRKLTSILALAAGAAALHAPGDADAAIVVYDVGPFTVGFDSGQSASAAIDLLPGLSPKQIVFEAGTNVSRSYFVRAGFSNATSLADRIGIQASGRSLETNVGVNVAFRTGYGPTWGATARTAADTRANIVFSAKFRTGTNTLVDPPVYYSQLQGAGPGALSDKYLLFTFRNSASGFVNYGWIHLASVTRSPGTPAGMSVTIDKWAYQDNGTRIRAGQTMVVPEPTTTASLAMGGALVAGAVGLRAWRRRRADEARPSAG